jgi:acyl-CoA reductase-like NAD-dependent aldehyde dehydrogenase
MPTVRTDLPRHDHYIAGEHVPPATGEYFASINPTTGRAWYEAASGRESDVDKAVAAARTAFESPSWRDLSQTARGRLLRRLGDLIGEHAEELASTETKDNGKLLREMRAQLAGLPEYFYYYAGYADKLHGEVIPPADPASSTTRCANRWASSPRSPRGTRRCCCPLPRSPQRWPLETPW